MNEEKQLISYQIKSYITDYLTIQRDLPSNTISTYSYGLLKFIKYLKEKNIDINTLKIKDLTLEIVNGYIEYMHNNNLSGKTINNRITILKSFVKYVASKDASVLEINRQFAFIKNQKETEKTHEYLTVEEIKLIMKEAKENIKYYCILSVAYECGLRVSEICNLKKEDLLLDKNNPRIIIEKGKGNKTREVILSSIVTNIIRKYLSMYNNDNELLFTNKYNHKYSSKGINYIFKKYYFIAKEKCNNNTMFKYNPHMHILRHSKGVHLVDNDVPLVVIRDIFGHKSIKTTEIYARISTKKKKNILEQNNLVQDSHIKRNTKKIIELEEFLKNSTKIN